MKGLFNRHFLALWAVSFLTGVVTAPLYALFAVYVEAELGRPPIFSAGLRSVLLLLGGLFAIPGGALCDRIGRKRTLLLSLTGPLASGLIFLIGDPIALSSLCLYVGAASGLNSTAGQSYLIGSVPASSLGVASAAYFLGATFGSTVGNALAGPVVDALGFRPIGWAMAGAMATLLIGAALLMPDLPGPPSTYRSSTERNDRRGDGETGGQGKSPPPIPWTIHRIVSPRTLSPSPRRGDGERGYAGLVRRPGIRLLLALRYLPTCYWGVATLLIPLLLYRASGAKSSAAYYSALSLLVASLFQVLIGRVCDAIGRRTPVLIASAMVALTALLTALFSNSVGGLYVFGILNAASAWSLSTTMPGLIDDLSGPHEKGRVVGLAHLAWSAGMLSGNLGGGRLVEVAPALPFYLGAALCALSVACAWAIRGHLTR